MNAPCPLCGGECAPGETTFTTDLGFGVVVIRHVPALVCQCCGEDWLEDATAEQLETMVAEARRKHSTVEIAEWRERIAA
ncbi:type II toxin-antitoxin system MqsA family antitoxin [Magnetovirga frankeli]|uniref:type II toxin-antitoxin system MqsA family antitoxin n=1 Tax=Magnetovirga frankeli TaxID=947516 RepID=UPI001293C4C2|nr:type II toxin-antitoxin system MqsA family antitoxin [gamma proteobacterium SS-5]